MVKIFVNSQFVSLAKGGHCYCLRINSGTDLCKKRRRALVRSRPLASHLPLFLAGYLHSFKGVFAVGRGARLEALLSWHLRRQACKRILLCQLFPAMALDKGLYSSLSPSTLLQTATPTPPTCQWISNYWPSWSRIFGCLYLMWQQQVKWSGSGAEAVERNCSRRER